MASVYNKVIENNKKEIASISDANLIKSLEKTILYTKKYADKMNAEDPNKRWNCKGEGYTDYIGLVRLLLI